jgi:hypothetical protein
VRASGALQISLLWFPQLQLQWCFMAKKTPSLAVGRGEKLSVEKGAGLTAKGRAKYNRETGSDLKAPQPKGGARKDSFCARMSGVVEHSKGDAPRAKASLKRWDCPDW